MEFDSISAQFQKLRATGSRSLSEIHSKPYAYAIFHRLFNISFFIPNKDLCETCVAYENPAKEKNC